VEAQEEAEVEAEAEAGEPLEEGEEAEVVDPSAEPA
jgi:hypothetical protein